MLVEMGILGLSIYFLLAGRIRVRQKEGLSRLLLGEAKAPILKECVFVFPEKEERCPYMEPHTRLAHQITQLFLSGGTQPPMTTSMHVHGDEEPCLCNHVCRWGQEGYPLPFFGLEV